MPEVSIFSGGLRCVYGNSRPPSSRGFLSETWGNPHATTICRGREKCKRRVAATLDDLAKVSVTSISRIATFEIRSHPNRSFICRNAYDYDSNLAIPGKMPEK